MAQDKASSTSFNDIVQAGRKKKKNEALAQEIFGRGRRVSGLPLGAQTGASKGSLASRITKPAPRSASSTGIRPSMQQTLKRAQSTMQIERGSGRQHLLRHALEQESRPASQGFAIKGKAGPFVVVGSNFAPGTTSADIQAVMEPVGGEMVSCMIVTASPTVIAEMVFEEKSGADAVIARFNNQRADGRLLHMYHKNGPPATQPLPSAAQGGGHTNRLMAAVEGQSSSRRTAKEAWGEGERSERRAEPEIQDGTHGFGSQNESRDVDMDVDQEARNSRRGGRHGSGRGGLRDNSRRGRDGPRSYDSRAQRPERGLYSDAYGSSGR